ncbi:MAG: molybdopterin-binding protein [Tepidimonas sp.]|uniref:competence/damage-inducible protein A n=1 Tax=Tepidimonas sp. TaxID=2002775 RepID=UPI00298EDB4B|nr:molybdopterin-binding protein [Tepidimonas sp.]MDW8336597.1 molybdopterin-binding protein [Tepidimonas sp.]
MSPVEAPQAVRFGLIVVGDEILSGKRQDKHLGRVIELLQARGLTLAWAHYVGDDRAALTALLKQAFASGDIVFSTGGIGATPDDHTRQAAAAALGVPMQLHPEAKQLIEQRMREVAAEQGVPFDPDRPDNQQRLQMGVFPQGADIIPNPYNKIPGFTCRLAGGGVVHFVPGFPVMAWPMIEWVLDTQYADLHGQGRLQERSVIVLRAMEAALTPLMERIEAQFEGVKVFSLPSVDHPQYGRHIELGVKGRGEALQAAYRTLLDELRALGQTLGPELVR